MTWDFLLTLNEEINLIWRSRLSIITVIFLVMRYLALVTQYVTMTVILSDIAVSHTTCRGYIWFRSLSSGILACTSQILLIYRVLVFYNWNFILKLSLGALFLATNISIFVLLFIGISSYMIIPNPFPSLNATLGGCSTFSYPRALSNLWIPELIFQSILFILVFSKFCIEYSELRNMKIAGRQRRISQIYVVFIRDGIRVYVIQLGILLLCVICNRHTNFLGVDFILWQIAVTSICCTRLILNLRALGPQAVGQMTRVGYTPDDQSIELALERKWHGSIHVVGIITET